MAAAVAIVLLSRRAAISTPATDSAVPNATLARTIATSAISARDWAMVSRVTASSSEVSEPKRRAKSTWATKLAWRSDGMCSFGMALTYQAGARVSQPPAPVGRCQQAEPPPKSRQEIGDNRDRPKAGGNIDVKPDSELRSHAQPSGSTARRDPSAVTLKVTVTAPVVERFRRRSWVHRPTAGYPESPLVYPWQPLDRLDAASASPHAGPHD